MYPLLEASRSSFDVSGNSIDNADLHLKLVGDLNSGKLTSGDLCGDSSLHLQRNLILLHQSDLVVLLGVIEALIGVVLIFPPRLSFISPSQLHAGFFRGSIK